MKLTAPPSRVEVNNECSHACITIDLHEYMNAMNFAVSHVNVTLVRLSRTHRRVTARKKYIKAIHCGISELVEPSLQFYT